MRPIQKTLFVFLIIALPNIVRSQCITLANAFAHNDYRHRHPLMDAESNGYTHIEADVFLHSNRLVVAHINPYFKGNHRTLENLYLEPLMAQIQKNNGQVYVGYDKPVTLMIDIKTDANKTYALLKQVLEKYRSVLSSYDDGKVSLRAITIVLSGHKPIGVMKNEQNRYAFVDEDLRKTSIDTATTNMFTMASCKYSKLISWNGNGAFSDSERDRLRAYVDMAHKNGQQVRLWASPENKSVWKEMLSCGVDLINTDKLVALKNFLIARSKTVNQPVITQME